MKQLASFSIAAAAVAVLLLLFTAPVITVAAAQTAPETSQGQQIFLAQNCNTCHPVPTAGIEAKVKSASMRGPDLVNLSEDAPTLKSFVTQKAEMNGKKHKKAAKGTDEELDALIDWLLSQKQ
jgi:mono/diheme cytochrome c family protein